jgi:hypothetical protein
MVTLDLQVRYEGGIADEHQLDLYDAADSLKGLARSLVIPGHFLANGEVIHQAPWAKNVHARLLTSKPGSFETLISLILDPQNGPLVGVATAAATTAANEFFRYLFRKVVGDEEEHTSQITKNIIEQNGPSIDALGDAIENDVVNIHRPIITGSNNIIIMGNGNRLVTLDQASLDYTRSTILDQEETIRIGRVSAFNANSQRGRIYDSRLRRVVPFFPESKFNDAAAELIAWSLSQYVKDLPGDIELTVRAVRSVGGDVKRYRVTEVTRGERARAV